MCMLVRMYVSTYVCMHAWLYACMYDVCLYVHVCMYACFCTNVRMYVCTHACMHCIRGTFDDNSDLAGS